tara:strand:+ start:18599 stop:18817 length:219 start_codon:yes stop_codon:yes gene_type:complete
MGVGVDTGMAANDLLAQGALISHSVLHWITPAVIKTHLKISSSEQAIIALDRSVRCVVKDFELQYCVGTERK